jgi:hypothetical protein
MEVANEFTGQVYSAVKSITEDVQQSSNNFEAAVENALANSNVTEGKKY